MKMVEMEVTEGTESTESEKSEIVLSPSNSETKISWCC